ncbi:MAG TPA: hypothetical protein VHX39_13480 [Acetobacteraceae bacterium]|nr:hypothetical protein [Acetobacteraceae bacterium]
MSQALVDELPAIDSNRVHPAFFSVGSLVLITPLCIVGAIIGTQRGVTTGL